MGIDQNGNKTASFCDDLELSAAAPSMPSLPSGITSDELLSIAVGFRVEPSASVLRRRLLPAPSAWERLPVETCFPSLNAENNGVVKFAMLEEAAIVRVNALCRH